jgi:L-threonylcarbamoyladenylate synthase
VARAYGDKETRRRLRLLVASRMPETTILKVGTEAVDPKAMARAAEIIRNGGLVAFPTETVYGLGADAMNEKAVLRIFEAKQRPADNPLIVHIANREMLSRVAARIDERSERLIEAFWPGPLTLVLERRSEVASSVSAGLPTIAVRMPRNKIALELITRANTPIAAPSANLSGRPSPTRAKHVAVDLSGRIEMILDAGPTRIGIESTVLDVTGDPPLILRPGWITREMISATIGAVAEPASGEELKRSPGTRHRHYSPRARLVLIENGSPEFTERICRQQLETGSVGFIGHSSIEISGSSFIRVTLMDTVGAYARSVYAALRDLDEKEVDVIVVEGIGDSGEAAAVMDRLRRAASTILSESARPITPVK